MRLLGRCVNHLTRWSSLRAAWARGVMTNRGVGVVTPASRGGRGLEAVARRGDEPCRRHEE